MTDQDSRYTFNRVTRLVLSAATIVAVLALLRYLSDVLMPFAAAVVLAYLLNPLVTFIEKKTRRRGLSVAITIGGLGIVSLALVPILLAVMVGQVREFGGAIETLRSDMASTVASPSVEIGRDALGESTSQAAADGSGETEDSSKSTLGWTELKDGWSQYRKDSASRPRSQRLAELMTKVSGTYVGDIFDAARKYTKSEQFTDLLADAAKSVLVGGWTVFSFALNIILGLTGLIVVLLYVVFLLLDFPEYSKTWDTFLPPAYRETIVEFTEQFSIAMRRYFRGQSVIALLTGTGFALGFTLIGLPMAVPFGLFIGLLNMVPYLQTVALVPAMLLAGLRAIEGDSSFAASVGLTMLIFAALQIFQDAVLTPRILGKATGLSPIAILLGVFIWGKLLGFLGLIMAIPLTCLGIAYYRRYVLLHSPAETKLVEKTESI